MKNKRVVGYFLLIFTTILSLFLLYFLAHIEFKQLLKAYGTSFILTGLLIMALHYLIKGDQ